MHEERSCSPHAYPDGEMHSPPAGQASVEASEWLDYEAAEVSSIWKYWEPSL